ncbi:hypothetical protein ACQUEN_02430 [Lactococcus taiwanensis]|uniref:hypothetical protein n=1 Tax=Lactococcus taiwanensis TaxID=1151742 RepID=UPI003D14331A
MKKISEIIGKEQFKSLLLQVEQVDSYLLNYSERVHKFHWSFYNSLELYLSSCEKLLELNNVEDPFNITINTISSFFTGELAEMYRTDTYSPWVRNPDIGLQIIELRNLEKSIDFYEIEKIFSFDFSVHESIEYLITVLKEHVNQKSNVKVINVKEEVDKFYSKAIEKEIFNKIVSNLSFQWSHTINSVADVLRRKLPVSARYVIKYEENDIARFSSTQNILSYIDKLVKKGIKTISILPCEGIEFTDDIIAYFAEIDKSVVSTLKDSKMLYYIPKREVTKFIDAVGYKGKVAKILKDLIKEEKITQHFLTKFNSDKPEIFFEREDVLKALKPFVNDYI